MSINLQRFQELSEGEPEGLQGLIRFFVTTTAQQLQDLERAIESRKAPEAARLAHSLIGPSLMVGMTSLSDILRPLETVVGKGDFAQTHVLLGQLTEEFASIRAQLQLVGNH